MGSLGFIVLGLATLGAVTIIVLKTLSMQEKAEEREHNRLQQYKGARNDNANR